MREDPHHGTLVHWASILTCFKTTCFIRPSALNKPSWKNAAAAACSLHNSEPTAPLRQHTNAALLLRILLSFCHSPHILTADDSRFNSPFQTDAAASSSRLGPDSGFSGFAPVSVRCTQLPQNILFFYASLIPEAGICPLAFPLFFPHSTSFTATELCSVSAPWCPTGPATCCHLLKEIQLKEQIM